jgi:hypothetical protein
MAKKSVQSKRSAKTARARAARAAAPHEDDHVDGCDVDIREEDATPDADLPAATGGVEAVSRTGRGRRIAA